MTESAAKGTAAGGRGGADAPRTVAAVDLGATSGRVITGTITDGVLTMRHEARFPNNPVRTRDGLHWNLLGLYQHVLDGLAAAERDAPGQIASIGIDSWAVDYALLRDGRVLGVPYAYRDERTARGVEAVHAIVSPEELYRRNGLQHLPFNTVFQLATDGELLELAEQMLLLPDLLAYWLTGAQVAERTNASTTGLLRADTREWDAELAEQVGVPARILPHLVDPGAVLGSLEGEAARVVGRDIDVVAVGSHDTASAIVAIPNTGRDFAYVSCGTWGLVGLELDEAVVTDAAREANFTNEGGVDGRVRFLHNVMGLWLLSESQRHWEPAATDAQRSSTLQQLLADAAQVAGDVPIFDVNDPVFMAPGDIPGRITAWLTERGLEAPTTPAGIVRSIVESLAQAFADAVATASNLAEHPVSVIHIVGGGSQNTLLCQATADRSGLPVLAGPVEATAMGNLLVQARAHGWVPDSLAEIRSIVARSTQIIRYDPKHTR
ncbi:MULTISPECIES: rhamnulokinase [unclassified Pseudoclavibacter]|jgi:rhamnulokinase|uniref:rhamnulokinase n=1 Tax=unclassified Pseudoclavibacter TaxID=2615177 RepID=UPI001BA6721E|nr:rhamnulokinase family protein [Pseudoclavibacter sp. Marseille-Q4354]MBS3179469.1 rhamnulokinase [Pseudoclavibacter sp. Marseille-Q4354]